MINQDFWRGRSVFMTGHTGFKGGWLCLWLSQLGAKIHGYALEAPTTPSFFIETQLHRRLQSSTIGDIRDLPNLISAMRSSKPSIVFHMAAQPLVLESYKAPVETFTTNVIGTVNLLESVRQSCSVEAVINVTSDKCYENQERAEPYRETDRLGGHDPYSSSKACAELAAIAYRKSFLSKSEVHLASVRAGNVIGGGDWATDRLVPDFLRALDAGRTLRIRSPNAVRPWQHVLDPLSGYLLLAERIVGEGSVFADAWNFGPDDTDAKPVSSIADHLVKKFPRAAWEREAVPQPHEACLLKLDSVKAREELGWAPRWPIDKALDETIEWHKAWKKNHSMVDVSIKQIEEHQGS